MNIISHESDEEELPLPSVDFEGNLNPKKFEGSVLTPKKLGRTEGRTNIPQLTKEIIAVHSNLSVDQAVLARAEGISREEVSIIERGIDRTNIDGRRDVPELKAIGQQARHKIVDLATTKLMDSLNLFNPNALEQKELPSAASKLASVAEKLIGNRETSGNQINFIVYQPRVKSEEDFGDVIELNER